MKIALLYDDLYQKGGGEDLFLLITKIFPKAKVFVPIVVSHYCKKISSKRLKYSKVLTFLSQFGRLGYFIASVLSLYWFESLKFNRYDVVISLSNRFSHCIVTPAEVKHINIVTTPFRALWEQNTNSTIKQFIQNHLRIHNFNSAKRADVTLAISNYVKAKISKTWKIKSDVIKVPLIKAFTKTKTKSYYEVPYFLLVGRLTRWKNFIYILSVFKDLKYNLIVAGEGPHKETLVTKYSKYPNIIFAGRVSDKKLATLYKHATALIHPQIEDFGLTPLEALHFNTPTIAYKKGGVLDYLNDKIALFYSNKKQLNMRIKQSLQFKIDKKEAKNILLMYSIKNFKYNLVHLVTSLKQQHV